MECKGPNKIVLNICPLSYISRVDSKGKDKVPRDICKYLGGIKEVRIIPYGTLTKYYECNKDGKCK